MRHMLLLALLLVGPAMAAPVPNSDPVQLGIMQGYPLPPERQVTSSNWLTPPLNRWSFRHVQSIFPTGNIDRKGGPIAPLPEGRSFDVGSMAFIGQGGRQQTGADYFAEQRVDAFLVLHNGRVVFERYFAGQTPRDHHLWMSTTKSLTGLLALMLADKGLLDLDRTAGSYVPEIAGSPYGQASLRHLLDMEVNITQPQSVKVADLPPDFLSNSRFLDSITSDGSVQAGPNGQRFFYTNTAPQTIGLVMTHMTGKSWHQLASELIWQKLGAERDGAIMVDIDGQAAAAGLMNSTSRDAARFMEMIRNDGMWMGQEVVPARVIRQLRVRHDNRALVEAGNVAMLKQRPGMTYKAYWYQVNDGSDALECLGVFGQHYYTNPKTGLTIIQHSSYQGPGPEAESWAGLVAALNARFKEGR